MGVRPRVACSWAAAALVILVAFTGQPVSAAPASVPAEGAGQVKADRDGDKVFDELEARLSKARTAASTKVDVIVSLHSPPSASGIDSLEKDVGRFAVKKRFSVIDGFSATMTKAQVQALARRADVAQIEEDTQLRAANDSAQASFGVTKARADVPGLDGDGDGSLASYSNRDLVAAVLDTGIDTGHRDLDGGKVLAFNDLVNGRTAPYDDNGHGTHVAASLAGDGEARPDRLYKGVAPGAALVSVKVLDASGFGSESATTEGVEWAVANRLTYGIKVINLSLGGTGCSDGTDALSRAINRAHQAGVVVAVAAGNAGPGTCTIGSPGAAAGAVTVGSMADLASGGFSQSSFSSRGPTLDGRVKPDVSAPGERITSAAAGTVNGYMEGRGTSMATPFVAGVAVLMLDANPALSSQQVKDKLVQTAQDWGRGGNNRTAGSTGPDIDYGAGRLDAYAAIVSARGIPGVPPEVATHARFEGTLAGTGAQVEREVFVTDTRFPLAATLIIPAAAGGQSLDPDFDLYLFGPGGNLVASMGTLSRQEQINYLPTSTGTYTLLVSSYLGAGDFFADISVGGQVGGGSLPVWSSWQRLGGVLRSGPGVSSSGPGSLDVFVRGTDDALYQRSSTNGAGNWQRLGGAITADPDAVSWDSGRTDVFVRGTDNALYQRSSTNGVWGDWLRLGGVLRSGPGVSSWGPGRLDVFVRGTDDALYQRSFANGSWGDWQRLGGAITADPDAVSWDSGRIDVFVRGTDNALYQRSSTNGVWGDWQRLVGALRSGPGVSSWGPGRLDVFVRGTDDALYQRSFTSGFWGDWQLLGGVLTADPDAVSSDSSRIDVFVRGTDDALYQRWFGPGP